MTSKLGGSLFILGTNASQILRMEVDMTLLGIIVFIVAINLLLDLTPGIDIWGHIGGLLGGLIFTFFAGPRFEVEGIYPALHLADTRESREVLTGAAAVILIFGALTVWGIIAPLTQ